MRPLKRDANPAYEVPEEMKTGTEAIKDGLKLMGVRPVQGGDTFDTGKVLDALLRMTVENKGLPEWEGLLFWEKDTVVALIKYFTENKTMAYGNARGSLIDNFGQYCGYCGMKVDDHMLAIEHNLPKAVFPSKMLEYNNFYLSCPNCNSKKGSRPTFAVSKKWMTDHGVPNPTIEEIMDGGISRQIWPDNVTWAWSGFWAYLYDIKGKNQIDWAKATNLNNTISKIKKNIVQANIYEYGQDIPVATLMGITYDSDILRDREDNFVDIVKLNSYEEDDYGDRRVTNRTTTWFAVLASLNNLKSAQPGGKTWRLILDQIFMTAKEAGYFEIWSYLFYRLSPPSVGQDTSVYLQFRAYSTDKLKPLYYFPGTNVDGLPSK